jgi:hypothetical protein
MSASIRWQSPTKQDFKDKVALGTTLEAFVSRREVAKFYPNAVSDYNVSVNGESTSSPSTYVFDENDSYVVSFRKKKRKADATTPAPVSMKVKYLEAERRAEAEKGRADELQARISELEAELDRHRRSVKDDNSGRGEVPLGSSLPAPPLALPSRSPMMPQQSRSAPSAVHSAPPPQPAVVVPPGATNYDFHGDVGAINAEKVRMGDRATSPPRRGPMSKAGNASAPHEHVLHYLGRAKELLSNSRPDLVFIIEEAMARLIDEYKMSNY